MLSSSTGDLRRDLPLGAGEPIFFERGRGAISQMGTPEEIVANPVNKYVADFTEDVPRYKVLSAGKVMRSAKRKKLKKDETSVPVDAKIDSLIDIIADSDTALPVVDAQGNICGEIDRSIMMKAMRALSILAPTNLITKLEL